MLYLFKLCLRVSVANSISQMRFSRAQLVGALALLLVIWLFIILRLFSPSL